MKTCTNSFSLVDFTEIRIKIVQHLDGNLISVCIQIPSQFKCDTHQWGHIITRHPTPVANTCASQIEKSSHGTEAWKRQSMKQMWQNSYFPGEATRDRRCQCVGLQRRQRAGVFRQLTRCRCVQSFTNPEEHPVVLVGQVARWLCDIHTPCSANHPCLQRFLKEKADQHHRQNKQQLLRQSQVKVQAYSWLSCNTLGSKNSTIIIQWYYKEQVTPECRGHINCRGSKESITLTILVWVWEAGKPLPECDDQLYTADWLCNAVSIAASSEQTGATKVGKMSKLEGI